MKRVVNSTTVAVVPVTCYPSQLSRFNHFLPLHILSENPQLFSLPGPACCVRLGLLSWKAVEGTVIYAGKKDIIYSPALELCSL